MKIKYLHMCIILTVLLVAGFFRENIFTAVNYQIKSFENGYELWNFTGGYSFLNSKTPGYYLTLKWIMTILFFLLHWAVALYMVWAFFKEKWNFRLAHFTWLTVFVLSAAVYGLFGWLISENSIQTKGYEFARLLMGAGQSPVLVMIVAVICRVRQKLVNQV